MAYPGDYEEWQKARLEADRFIGRLQSECRRLRTERDEARSRLAWLESKLRQQGLWTSLVKEMETEFHD